MKLIESGGILFILDEVGQLKYTIDTNENTCWSKEFDQWVSLKGLTWEEF